MKNNENKILIQQNDKKLLNWGAEVWGEYSSEDVPVSESISIKNSSIAFIEIAHTDKMSKFEQKFYDAIKKIESIDNEISCKKQNQHKMTVGKIMGAFVELIPSEEDMGFQYILTAEYYDSGHDWFPLETGDVLCTYLYERNGTRISCKVSKILSRAHGNRLITIGSQVNRLDLDLSCMAGRAVIQAKVVGAEIKHYDNVEHTYLKMKLGNILLWGSHDICWNSPEINGISTGIGTTYNMCVTKSGKEEAKRPYFLSFTKMENGMLSTLPDDVKLKNDKKNIVGTVYQISTNTKSLLWVNFDSTWSSCIFKNKMPMKIWGPLISKYLPIGFPAQFKLDIDENKENHRLQFVGMSSKLDGRVKYDADALYLKNRLLEERVFVSPHRLLESENKILVTSPYYAGYATANNIPDALLRYCKQGIFTPEMMVPATVRIKKNAVRFNINYALEEELERIRSLTGKKEQMKICSIHLGTAYLTTDGGYPIEYICQTEEEEKLLRSKMFTKHNFTFCIEDINEIRVTMEDNFDEKLEDVDIPLGGFFFANNVKKDKDGIWYTELNGIDCIITPESVGDREISNNDKLMLIARDSTARSFIAVANTENFSDYFPENKRIQTIRSINSELWLCSDDDHLALMYCTNKQSSLIEHLCNIYGVRIPVDVKQMDRIIEGAEAAKCMFCGVACGADYSMLFKEQPIKLQLPITEQTPRVLYNDVVLELDNKAITYANYVIPNGLVSQNGTMYCRAIETDKIYSSTGINPNLVHKKDIGKVQASDKKGVQFVIGNEEIYIKAEELNIPHLEHISISDVFTNGSEWLLEVNAGVYNISNSCSDDICKYVLVKEYNRIVARKYYIHKWIVKSSEGSLAVTELTYGQEGDSLLMVKDGEIEKGITFVTEPDLIGRQMSLTLNSVEDNIMKCSSVDNLAIAQNYYIMNESWNWVSSKLPYRNISHLLNSSFIAKIKEIGIQNSCMELDRRSTLEQCELLSTSKPEGIYQMKVEGINENGYILRQNSFTAILPWNEVSLCNLPIDENIRKEFIKHNTLLEVELCYDKENKEYRAQWRSNLGETYKRWKEYVKYGGKINAIIYHITADCLFLDIEGEYMYVTANEIGLWKGDSLKEYFHIGQYLSECKLKYDQAKDVFSIQIDNKYIDMRYPEKGSELTACVFGYKESTTLECYVKYNNSVAIVPETELGWNPIKPGEKPYVIGEKVKIFIDDIDTKQRKIIASIRKAMPRPKSGPASIGYTVPIFKHMDFHSLDEDNNIIMTDSEMLPAILLRSDHELDPVRLSARIKSEQGIWLPIVEISAYKGKLFQVCSYSMLKKSNEEIQQALKQEGDRKIITAKVLSVSLSKLTIQYNNAIGYINRNDFTGQIMFPVKKYYKIGDEVECVIIGVKETNYHFQASVFDLYPGRFRDITTNLNIGENILVIVCGYSSNGIRVKIDKTKLFGILPPDEVSHKPNFDYMNWGEKRMNDYIKLKCIDINYESCEIIFSRKQIIAEGVED